MDRKDAVRVMDDLIEKIDYYNKQFFQYHRSLISDYAFDQLMDRLVALEEAYPDLKRSDSPTNRVGEGGSKGFVTRDHIRPMLSLGNTYAVGEVEAFHQRMEKVLGVGAFTYFCELKFDGVAISIHYEGGRLKHVITRGDGVSGDDITANGLVIGSIPSVIKAPNVLDVFEVRGEVFMTREAFKAVNERQVGEGKPLFANPRNTAAGTLKMLDSSVVADRQLSFCPYTLIADGVELPTQASCIAMLEGWGFEVSPTYRMCRGLEEVLSYIAYWEGRRDDLPMEIDGVVIKVNERALQEVLGVTSKSPRWAIAYKYKPQGASALLEGVMYQVGRTGVVTPVARLSPTRLAGSTIQRATLHNSQEIETLDLRVGDTVFLEKGGDVIPKITAVDLSKRGANSVSISFITHCPSCDTLLVKEEGGAHHYCPNREGCAAQLKGRLRHFVHRKAMNIVHMGEKTIDLLFDKGIIQRPADLYGLGRDSFIGLEGFKARAVQNILSSIEESKGRPFHKVLFALGIRHVGATVAEKLALHFGDMQELSEASEEVLLAIPEVGQQIARSLMEYFQADEVKAQLKLLCKAGLQFAQSSKGGNAKGGVLLGKSFVITGTFDGYSREEMQAYVKANGGRLLGVLSSKVDYLVAGHHAGSAKVVKAERLGVEVISEEAIQRLVGR